MPILHHMLLASTSSAYGANEVMPYKEVDKADHQMSFYAATKSTENMAHSYSHLFNLPITVFRFSLSMVHGVDQIWPYLNSPRQFLTAKPLMCLTMVI